MSRVIAFIVFVCVCGIAAAMAELVKIIINIWYSRPIKEEKSTPIYITKELDKK